MNTLTERIVERLFLNSNLLFDHKPPQKSFSCLSHNTIGRFKISGYQKELSMSLDFSDILMEILFIC